MDNKDLPAMPLVNANGHPYHANSIAWENSPLTSGLTKREVFAKAAMQAILANTHLIDNLDSASVDFLVTKSAIVADAQLAQLDKGDK